MAKVERPPPHSKRQYDFVTVPGDTCTMAGRRWGKTTGGVWRIERNAIQYPGSVSWWVGISWRSASMGVAWKLLLDWHASLYAARREKPDRHRSLVERVLRLPNGSEIATRTAERPDSLAGAGVKMAVLDEFSLMRRKVWEEYIEGTLLDTPGTACLIGVPKGPGWHADIWKKAATRDGWTQFHFTTYDNPVMELPEQARRLESARVNTPKRIFDQEYLASLTELAGQVFKNVTEATTAPWVIKAQPDRSYVMGVDWGKQHDYTVITVFDVDAKACVYYERFNGISYVEQLKRIHNMVRRFAPRHIVAEENAMGTALIDQLSFDGLPMRRFTTTAQSKRKIIEKLAVAFENYTIQIPSPVEDDSLMINELIAFEVEYKNGAPRYGAPEGERYHDDIVLSMCFAWDSVNYDTGISF